MHFSEPLTAFTDYALGAASLYFAVSLLRAESPRPLSVRLWSLGFFASAIAALVGGTYHAMELSRDGTVFRSMWNITLFSIGASGAFMVSGVLTSSIQRHHRSRTRLLNGLWITLAGMAAQQTNLSLHNDIFHLTQIVGLYFFFTGARLLEDRVVRG